MEAREHGQPPLQGGHRVGVSQIADIVDNLVGRRGERCHSAILTPGGVAVQVRPVGPHRVGGFLNTELEKLGGRRGDFAQ